MCDQPPQEQALEHNDPRGNQPLEQRFPGDLLQNQAAQCEHPQR